MSRPPILGRLRSFFDTIRGSYWFLPTWMAFGAVAAAFGLVELDRTFDFGRVPWIGSAEAANTRSVLSVIAGSMITVTGVVFSITVVALTLASSQFGPRILRNFLRAQANQIAFGTFVATFLYSLLVLRAVRDNEVPHVASAVAVALAVVSLFVLIYFIHHTARSIQASTVIASVAKEIDGQVARLFPQRLEEHDLREDAQGQARALEELRAQVTRDGIELPATSDGYVRVLDDDAVLGMAVKHDLRVVLRYRPGDFICAGNSLARVGPAENVTDEARSALRESFVLGDYRTPVQDLRMLTGQLTEIALRALSPGVNDPRTASDCVQRLGAVICATAGRKLPSGFRRDESDQLRVVLPHTTFEEIVSSCFDPIRRYGMDHIQIVVAMFDALRDAGECCRDSGRRRVLAEHALEIRRAFEARNRQSSRDVAEVERAFERAMKLLDMPT